jgi:mRNA-decapping enzyme subunit 2
MKAFEEFMLYKTRVPVRGAIMLNEAMDSAVLVKGWKKGANWSFPRGKINKDEDDLDCAIREVLEETGFDIREAGLVPEPKDQKYIEIVIREQQLRLYVFRGVPMDIDFQPRTRKEISKIEWYKLSELPAFRKKGSHAPEDDAAAVAKANKFYMVAPFLVQLKKWVVQQKKKDAQRASHGGSHLLAHLQEEGVTDDDTARETEAPSVEQGSATPAIDTLEGATRELQRLLKIQPPTQGVQVPSLAPGSSQNGRDKGEALLALLKAPGNGAPPPRQQPPPQFPMQHNSNGLQPQTPFDHLTQNAPAPHTPHHHHPQQRLPQQSWQQAPPPFPIAPNQNQSFRGYPAQPPFPPQSQQPPFGPFAQQLPYLRPVLPLQQFPERAQIPLQHPQPLPPQVQQAQLTRDLLRTPNLPDDTSGVAANNGQVRATGLHSMPPAALPPLSSQLAGLAPPQRSNQAMSLLKAFQNDAQPEAISSNAAPTANVTLTGQGQVPVTGRVPRSTLLSQAVPGMYLSQPTNPAVARAPPPPLQAAPAPTAPAYGASQSVMASLLQKAAPNEKNRSALLDMFKNDSGPVAAPIGNGLVAASGITSAQIKSLASSEATGRPLDVLLAGSNGKGIAAAPVPSREQAVPDTSTSALPFGATFILSRAKQAVELPASQPTQPQISQQPIPLHLKADQAASASPLTSSAAQQRQPQGPARADIEARRPLIPDSYGAPPPTKSAAFFSQTLLSGTGGPAPVLSQQAPASAMLHRPQQTSVDHKQKLLSLFAGPGPLPFADTPTITPLESAGAKSQPVAPLVSLPAQVPPLRTQATQPLAPDIAANGKVSAGSVGGGSESESRRGSQPPISPDERNFLLNYLGSVVR